MSEGPVWMLLFEVSLLGFAAALYTGMSSLIRQECRAERVCENPLHRAEAPTRAAISQTALALGCLWATPAELLVPWVLPAWLLGWVAIPVLGIAAVVWRGCVIWMARRTVQHDLAAEGWCCP